jgi:hypothetical protein
MRMGQNQCIHLTISTPFSWYAYLQKMLHTGKLVKSSTLGGGAPVCFDIEDFLITVSVNTFLEKKKCFL